VGVGVWGRWWFCWGVGGWFGAINQIKSNLNMVKRKWRSIMGQAPPFPRKRGNGGCRRQLASPVRGGHRCCRRKTQAWYLLICSGSSASISIKFWLATVREELGSEREREMQISKGEENEEEPRTVVVGVKMDAESRELLTWALVKVARAGDRVVALHVIPWSSGNFHWNPLVDSFSLFVGWTKIWFWWWVSCFFPFSGVELSDPNGRRSSLLSLVKAFDSVRAVYEGFCNLKQVGLLFKWIKFWSWLVLFLFCDKFDDCIGFSIDFRLIWSCKYAEGLPSEKFWFERRSLMTPAISF